MLEVKNLTVQYGSRKIVDDVTFKVNEGQWLMVVGPNGAGKSTIVNAISRNTNYSGDIYFEGQNIKKMKTVQLAKGIGILTQNHHVGYGFTVEEVVRLGRYAYSRGVLSVKREDENDYVEEALKITGMTDMRYKSVLTLSGGELQRTFLAQLFAQNPKLLILDEPTNHLDLVYQQHIFELIQEWLQKPGRAVLSVVHDLSLARAYGTDALLLNKGKTVIAGAAKQVLTPEYMNPAYQMDVAAWMQKMLQQWT